MDLGAYVNIEKLGAIAKANGIEIPRLRGYRLMKGEESVSKAEMKEMLESFSVSVVKNLCEARPFWSANPYCYSVNTYSEYLKKYFLTEDENGLFKDVRWDRIHGWKRRVLKFEIKKQKREIKKQYDLWNKYAGQDGVLYIHSRMGGNNWKYFDGKEELMNQPWFLDRVDDCFDSTYCDFYARIKE